MLAELANKEYRTSKSGSGWLVHEPLGGRVRLSTDDALVEYAGGRVNVPKELLKI